MTWTGNHNFHIEVSPETITEGGIVGLVAKLTIKGAPRETEKNDERAGAPPKAENPTHRLKWQVEGGDIDDLLPLDKNNQDIVLPSNQTQHHYGHWHGKWDTTGRRPGAYKVTASLVPLVEKQGVWQEQNGDQTKLAYHDHKHVTVTESLRQTPISVSATLSRAGHGTTNDQAFWPRIRSASVALSYESYEKYVRDKYEKCTLPKAGVDTKPLPVNGVDAYQKLKALTEAFLVTEGGCGLVEGAVDAAFSKYLEEDELPLFRLYLRRFPDLQFANSDPKRKDIDAALEIALQEKLRMLPCVELIWSYWHEEAGLVQAMSRISQRFQNIRSGGNGDPLANLEISHLRPLSNLLWGYMQDDMNRLSVVRRAHEYDHQYGFTLQGKAVAALRSADRRSKFLESFHTLLNECIQFFRRDDDTTVVADAFPVLNSIKEVHYLLAQGAHNQFGDLPTTARQEMLIQQWLLARPEMREFLGGRTLPYPEPWMDRMDAVKNLMGWSDVSVVHFHDLAVFGERLIVSLRYGKWSDANEPEQAANWTRFWRPEIQGYIHAYRAVTGVDISAPVTDMQRAQERFLPPSVHLQKRLAQQRVR